MKISADTWHARNWHFWLEKSHSFKKEQFISKTFSVFDPESGDWNIATKERRQPDLCTYTRIVMFYSPMLRFSRFHDRLKDFQRLTLDALIVIFLFGTFFHLVALIDSTLNPSWWLPYAIGIVGTLGVAAFFGIVFTFLWLVLDVIKPAMSSLRHKEDSESNRPNILIERVKARKRKVCPLIEFEEKVTNTSE